MSQGGYVSISRNLQMCHIMKIYIYNMYIQGGVEGSQVNKNFTYYVGGVFSLIYSLYTPVCDTLYTFIVTLYIFEGTMMWYKSMCVVCFNPLTSRTFLIIYLEF